MSVKVSVILSVYNSEDTVREMVASILAQTFTDFELIIINDGCIDRTDAILRKFEDPRIVLVVNDRNIGLTRSLNKAIGLAQGEYLARQDADDVSMPTRFEKQVKFLDEHPDVSLLGTARATLNRNGDIIEKRVKLENPQYSDLLKRNCFVHGSVMMRRKDVVDVGGYDELFRYTQDYELWLRMAKIYTLWNLQEPLYGMRRHENRVTLKSADDAALFRRLALDVSEGTVSDDVRREILEKGVMAYYPHLSDEDKMKYHRSVWNRSRKYKMYDKASAHLKKGVELNPCSPILRILLFMMMLRSRLMGAATQLK